MGTGYTRISTPANGERLTAPADLEIGHKRVRSTLPSAPVAAARGAAEFNLIAAASPAIFGAGLNRHLEKFDQMR
jgi:hypothetical protein